MRGLFECEHFGPHRHGHGHHGHPFGHHGHHGHHGPFGHHGHHRHGHGKFGHHHGFGPWGPGFGPHFGMRFGPWSMDDRRGMDGCCRRGPPEDVRCEREEEPGRHGPREDGPFRRGPFGHFHGRGPWERPGSPGCRRKEGKNRGCCCRKDDGKKDQGTQAFVIERVIVDNDPRCNSV